EGPNEPAGSQPSATTRRSWIVHESREPRPHREQPPAGQRPHRRHRHHSHDRRLVRRAADAAEDATAAAVDESAYLGDAAPAHDDAADNGYGYDGGYDDGGSDKQPASYDSSGDKRPSAYDSGDKQSASYDSYSSAPESDYFYDSPTYNVIADQAVDAYTEP